MNIQPTRNWLDRAFNTSILQKKRLEWVDYLRGIAIVLVVYRHVLIGLERSSFEIPVFLEKANMIFFSFRMPLFFILSGIFISGSIAKRSLGKLIFVKFDNLLYPYLIWATIQISLQIFLSGFTNSSRTVEDYSFIFYQPRALDQFWYLPALFNTSFIYLLTKTKLRFNGWMQLALGTGLYFLTPFFNQISMLSDWMEFYIFFALGDVLSNLFFKLRSQEFLKNRLTFLLVIPVFIVTPLYYLQQQPVYYSDDPNGRLAFLPIAIIGCFCMFVLAFRLQTWNIMRFLRIVGYHSLYIYVLHVIISSFVRIVLTKIFGIQNAVILLLCGIAAGVTISVAVYNLLSRHSIGWRLFSLRKPEINAIRTAPPKEKLAIPELQTNG
jgi:uncharacterized membrane protein YcfT